MARSLQLQLAPTTFRDYAQAGWVWADQDNLSTFSLDTDRTSFQLALNWAQSGYAIEPDSVRAEEWINSFSYGYRRACRMMTRSGLRRM